MWVEMSGLLLVCLLGPYDADRPNLVQKKDRGDVQMPMEYVFSRGGRLVKMMSGPAKVAEIKMTLGKKKLAAVMNPTTGASMKTTMGSEKHAKTKTKTKMKTKTKTKTMTMTTKTKTKMKTKTKTKMKTKTKTKTKMVATMKSVEQTKTEVI